METIKENTGNTIFMQHENAAQLTATIFGWWRKDRPQEVSYRYWRDVHGVLAARIPGPYQYRQLHLSSNRHVVFPAWIHIEHDLPLDDQPHGITQLLFLSAKDQQNFSINPLVERYIAVDEPNLTSRSAALWSNSAQAFTSVDRTEEIVSNGSPSHPSVVIALKQARGTSIDAFSHYLKECMLLPWSNQDAVLRLRLHLLDPYKATASPSPKVNHNWSEEKQYQAWIELVVRDEAFLQNLFTALPEKEEFVTICRAVHVFSIFARYTLIYDGLPTIVGLRGFPAIETIEQAGAQNQKAQDLLEMMYGIQWGRSNGA